MFSHCFLIKYWENEIEREETLPNSFYEDNIIFIPKLDKDTSRKENYRTVSLMNIDAEILNKIMQTKSNNTSERSSTMTSQLHPGMQGLFNICKSLNVIRHINRSKDKNHLII
jgi:hypothetical protein